MEYYQHTPSDTLDELDASERGLSTSDAAERLVRYGPNSVTVNGEPLWKKLVEPFANVFMAVLGIAVIISIWHHDYIDAVIIGVIIAASAIIYYVQRFSTERVLRALRSTTIETVEVLREGVSVLLPEPKLVPGDVILLSEGQKVPADARLIGVESLRVDESQLTGESLPIEKELPALDGRREVYEQSNMVFHGSFIVGGTARAVITSTGNQTQFGKLAELSSETTMTSPVQDKIDALLQKIIVAIIVVAAAAFGLALWQGMEIAEATRFVIALAVSVIPEDLPIATSVVLVLGMRRMAAHKALVRTMRAIETLGTLTTIATDKTGTLTKNKLTVQGTWHPDELDIPAREVLRGSLNFGDKRIHDPLDVALHDYLISQHKNIQTGKPLRNFAFDQAASMSGSLHHHGESYRLYIKGAPEKIIATSRVNAAAKKQAMDQLQAYTEQGYRVIALAWADIEHPFDALNDLPPNTTLEFAGLIAVADILRPEAKKAIATALSAGVTVRMITGDHLETAYHIGRELGMCDSRDQVFDCRAMRDMSDAELETVVDRSRVFSRVIPEQKHRLLTILKKHNITAMTGDGVNDVPALTNAHVGIAMGSGASIARDAGDIVLVDDNFKSIIDAIREGRIIFANIKRMVAFLLASNTGEVIVNLGALLMGLPIPLVPVQILWVNLVTDTSLVIPLGLEPGESDVMLEKPGKPEAPLFTRTMVVRVVLIAATVGSLTLGMYWLFTAQHGFEYGRTIAFMTLVAMQWGNALSMRSDHAPIWQVLRRPSLAFWIGLSLSIGLQMIAILTPLAGFLHIAPVATIDLITVMSLGFTVPIVVIELHKAWQRKQMAKSAII